MNRVLVFAGTTEGRLIIDELCSAGLSVHACVATDIGGMMISERPNLTVNSQRLDTDGMVKMIGEGGFSLVIDATHPYAVIVSRNIKEACSQSETDYMRVLRPEGRMDDCDDIIIVEDTDAAVEFLKSTKGNILVTTGSKELSKFTRIDDYKDRVFARVLSEPTVAKACADMGFQGRNLISMQGPFCEELNYGLIKQVGAEYMVTKDSGSIGGFEDKIRAASRAGVKTVLITRPSGDEGISINEALEEISNRFDYQLVPKDKTENVCTEVSIIGTGMGDRGMTLEAEADCREADVIFGAPRMASLARRFPGRFIKEYKADAIMDELQHGTIKKAAILYSGDIGIYSGARKMLDAFASSDVKVKIHNGVSSLAYMCSKMAVPLEDVELISLHGRDANVVGEVRRRRWNFLLLEGQKSIHRFCKDLIDYNLLDVKVVIGEDLGYPEERFVEGDPERILGMSFGKLCVALIENDHADEVLPLGLRDECFIRGDAPMTKKEVRCVSISCLGLCENSIIFDVGAGTGSVSIEMARIAVKGQVYAIEMDEDSASLIEQNARHLHTSNLKVVRGKAPDAFSDLPAPTHAFIGGSGGNLSSIVKSLMEKNPNIEMVINAVTLETLTEVLSLMKTLPQISYEMIQLSVSRAKELGSYRMLTAQNPIFILSINCKG